MELNKEARELLREQRRAFLLGMDTVEYLLSFSSLRTEREKANWHYGWRLLQLDSAWREAEVSRELLTIEELGRALIPFGTEVDRNIVAAVLEEVQAQLALYSPLLGANNSVCFEQQPAVRRHIIRRRYPGVSAYEDAREEWWTAFRDLDTALLKILSEENEHNLIGKIFAYNVKQNKRWFERDLHRWQQRERQDIEEIYAIRTRTSIDKN